MAAAGAAILVVVIVLIALSDGGGAGAKSVRKGAVELSYTDPWRIAAPAAAGPSYGLRFREPVALRDAGATLLAGMLADGAAVPGGLPPKLAANLGRKPSRKAVRLGAVPVLRYASTAHRGAMTVTLYVAPTDVGDMGVLCSEGLNVTKGSCANTAATLRLHGPHLVAAGADLALASELHAKLQPVARARGDLPGLKNPHSVRWVKTARGAAATDSRAAKELAKLQVEPRDRTAVAALAGALRREAHALSTAAAAAHARSYAKFDQAAKSVRLAGRTVAKATASLRRMGFRAVAALRALKVPPLRHPRPKPQPSESPVPIASIPSSPPVTPLPESAPAPPSPPEQPKVFTTKPE